MIENKEDIFMLGNELTDHLNRIATKVYFDKGDIFRMDISFCGSAFILKSGILKVYYTDIQDQEYFMYNLEGGQICALTLMDKKNNFPRKIIAKVQDDICALTVPLCFVQQWMNQHVAWRKFIMESYNLQINRLFQIIDDSLHKTVDQRLEKFLNTECQKKDNSTLLLSHQQIADELGSSREVVSRLLKKMEQKGKLRLKRNQIEICQ